MCVLVVRGRLCVAECFGCVSVLCSLNKVPMRLAPLRPAYGLCVCGVVVHHGWAVYTFICLVHGAAELYANTVIYISPKITELTSVPLDW